MTSLMKAITRRKNFIEDDSLLDEDKGRFLGITSITAIGVAQMIGFASYSVIGTVVHDQAGPAAIFSMLLAGLAALLAAFSYAELGGRFPHSGGSYTFTYFAVGEMLAFVTGVTMCLEYLLSLAATARLLSSYCNVLLDDRVRLTTRNLLAMNVTRHEDSGHHFFASYPDLFAGAIVFCLWVVVFSGTKISTAITNGLVAIQLTIMSLVVANAIFYIDFDNWSATNSSEISQFLPFGYGGLFTGAATCFFSFFGFEAMSIFTDEAKHPRKTIPRAIFSSVGVTTLAYVLMTLSLTLIVPYNKVSPIAPFSNAYASLGSGTFETSATLSTVLALFNHALTTAYAMPRLVCVLGDDGMIPEVFSRLSDFAKIPYVSNVVFAALAMSAAVAFELKTIMELVSIGTLFAYSIVSICVLVLRYASHGSSKSSEAERSRSLFRMVPDEYLENGKLLYPSIIISMIFVFAFALVLRFGYQGTIAGTTALFVCSLGFICTLCIIGSHRENATDAAYKVPLVPIIPMFSLSLNIFLMVSLSALAWVRLLIGLSIGLTIYLVYGLRNNKEAQALRPARMVNSVSNSSSVYREEYL